MVGRPKQAQRLELIMSWDPNRYLNEPLSRYKVRIYWSLEPDDEPYMQCVLTHLGPNKAVAVCVQEYLLTRGLHSPIYDVEIFDVEGTGFGTVTYEPGDIGDYWELA